MNLVIKISMYSLVSDKKKTIFWKEEWIENCVGWDSIEKLKHINEANYSLKKWTHIWIGRPSLSFSLSNRINEGQIFICISICYISILFQYVNLPQQKCTLPLEDHTVNKKKISISVKTKQKMWKEMSEQKLEHFQETNIDYINHRHLESNKHTFISFYRKYSENSQIFNL